MQNDHHEKTNMYFNWDDSSVMMEYKKIPYIFVSPLFLTLP